MSILKTNSVQRYSLFAFLFVSITFIYVKVRQVRSVEPFIRDSYALSWDNYGYYLHLPAFVIHHDIGIEKRAWVDSLNNKYQKERPFYQVWPGQKNRLVNVYPLGFAVFNLPFFLAGHVSAKLFGYDADGLSPPYQCAMIFSALFFGIMGMWFLRKLLIRYFNDGLTAILLLLIGLGTNLYYYATYECMLPHIYLFAADTLLILLTIRWHESPNRKTALYIGMLLGLVTITRPSEIVWILIPLFWNVAGWKSLKEKFQLFRQNIFHIVILVFGMVAVGSLQLFYWKYTSGHWFSFNHTEGFDFFHPFTLKVLFSYKKGWLLYTPMMLLAIFGFVALFKKERKLFIPFLLFFIANLWFISSWECWWYAGSFGQRPFVSSYGLMAIPLGFLLSGLHARPLLLRIAFYTTTLCFLLLNQFQTWQMNHDILNRELMTKEYYWKIFGARSLNPEWNSLLEIDRGNIPPFEQVAAHYFCRQILFYDYENPKQIRTDEILCDTIGKDSKYSEILDKDHVYGMVFKCQFDSLTQKDHLRIKFEADVFIPNENNKVDLNFNLAMIGDRGQAYGYSALDIGTEETKKSNWVHVTKWLITPEILHRQDQLIITVLNYGEKVFVDNAGLTLCEPK